MRAGSSDDTRTRVRRNPGGALGARHRVQVHQEVRRRRRGANLTQHAGDLPAVIGRVIDDVLQHVPQTVGPPRADRVFVTDAAIEVHGRDA